MNEPKTPNLGLNKIDRSSPSTTYFDLDKYLDQNWEKVDEGVGKVEEKAEETAAQVSSIQERLDTEKRRSVTLEPGLQIVHAERASAFKLEGLKGRTLVNLLGRIGGMENLTGLSKSYTTLALDSAQKTSGAHGLKITNLAGASTSAAGLAYTTVSGLKLGSYYVLITDAKNLDAEDGISIGFGGSFGGPYSFAVKSTDKFVTTWAKKQISTATAGNVDLAVVGSVGKSGYFDSVRLYEITATEYTALDNMTADQIAAKYPYVDSVQPVRNPYAIRYGENLIPPFYEWTKTGHTSSVTDQYGMNGVLITASIGSDAFASYNIDAIANQDYTLSNPIGGTGYLRVSTYDGADTRVQGIFVKPGESKTIKTSASVTRMTVVASGVTAYTDEFDSSKWTWTEGTSRIFKNPMLNIGSASLPFKPREDAMLALQTNLYAEPVTGTNADVVFERDGQYLKLAKWRKVLLDGNLSWQIFQSLSGYKQVMFPLSATAILNVGYATKFNGSVLTPVIEGRGFTAGDQFAVTPKEPHFTISNSDSGWGDSYTPTADEIKAYFMGWRMYKGEDGSAFTPYNGTGTKYWARIKSDGTFTGGETIVPKAQAVDYTSYQIVYQLATPTVEPITSEGQLTLLEGSNQVEVDTGIVLRESVKPALANSYYRFNDTTLSGTTLKNKLSKPLSMYRNSQLDYGWEFISDQYAYGTYKARKVPERYDVSAAYSITYFMMDTSPLVSFVGSVPDNEKALLTNLVQNVQQGATSLTVLERSLSAVLSALQENKRDVWGPIL
jgi:hypothetical protein